MMEQLCFYMKLAKKPVKDGSAGSVKKVLKRQNLEAFETKCAAKGDDCCKFAIASR